MALPSSWPQWDVYEEAAEAATIHFTAALYGGIPQRFHSGRDVVQLEGMIGKTEVTRILAGTDDKKSKAWKSAQRQQQRYRRGERGVKSIAAGKAAQLKAAARQWARSAFLKLDGPLDVTVSVKWLISRDVKKSTPTAMLTGDALTAFKAAVLGGKYIRAIQIVTWEWGLDPHEVAELRAVYGVRIG
jgi:hypothetical protein